MKQLSSLSITIFSNNFSLTEKISRAFDDFGTLIHLRPQEALTNVPNQIEGQIMILELTQNFKEILPIITQIKGKNPRLIIIGVIDNQLFEPGVETLAAGVDYLLTQPIKYHLLPYMVTKIT